jgi:hypothetical protein
MRWMLFFDGRRAKRAWPVVREYIRPNVKPEKSNECETWNSAVTATATGCSDALSGSARLPRRKGQDQYSPAIPEAVSRRPAPSRTRPALPRPTRPARKAWYQNLEEVTADGDFTATFRLKRPQPAIIALLPSGYAPVYPCHVLPRDMRQHPIGTGPFKFVEFKPNEYTRWRAIWITGSRGASRVFGRRDLAEAHQISPGQ